MPFCRGGKTPVAGDEIVCDNCDEPFARGIDDSCAHNPCRIAAKAHAHGERLFAAGAALFKVFVKVKRDAGQIAEVFEQGEEREKNRHRRKHHRDHPGEHPVNAEHEHTMHPLGGAKPGEKVGEPVLHPE